MRKDGKSSSDLFVLQHIEEFIRKNKERPEVQEILTKLSAQMHSGLSLEAASNIFKEWIKEGREDILLKSISELVCREALEQSKTL